MSVSPDLVSGRKARTIVVFAKDDTPTTYEGILAWKVTRNRTLIVEGAGWIEILAPGQWTSIRVLEYPETFGHSK